MLGGSGTSLIQNDYYYFLTKKKRRSFIRGLLMLGVPLFSAIFIIAIMLLE